jgi:N-methylhydantoinase A/oxoprolinase/acetone carboxylase beta subunit
MQKYIIGIDTGGTYTDAVLLNPDTQRIITTAKTPTTHHQLSIGTGEALAILLQGSGIAPDQIQKIAVSSTLATNSVVEKKGARVAVIVIGYVKHFKLPVKAVLYVKGGHTILGAEEEPLDIEYLVQLIEGLKSEVDAYGICSAMSIKNPTHELVAEKAISMIDPKPVFCSHRISELAGMHERAATAGLHAKLMPIMADFVDGVQQAMVQHGLTCPMQVIGGNGQAIDTEAAVLKAGLTVASGPACTAYFGANYAGSKEREAIVIDVGGTTTDIAMIKDGRPLIGSGGCQIGQWKTHVEAVDMLTTGIGGDSQVYLDGKGELTIGPSRVTPLSIEKDLPPLETWLGLEDRGKLIIANKERIAGVQGDLAGLLIKQGQLTPFEIRAQTGLGGVPLQSQLEKLARKQCIRECGFTPTDALHVLGDIELGDRATAVKAAQILGETLGIDGKEFARLVLRHTEDLIESTIIDYVVKHYWDKSISNFIASRKNHPVVEVDFAIKMVLIGIGAASRHLLPAVARRLKTSVIFPENCEVGNAAGAALTAAR